MIKFAITAVALAMLSAPAVAGAQSLTTTRAAEAEPSTAYVWDAVAEKRKSPYYTLEGYLSLRPMSEIGDHFEMPGLLADGRCSDPAGEGH